MGELAEIVGGEVQGDHSIKITGVAGVEQAVPGDITFVGNPAYAKFLATTRASAAIVLPSEVCELPSIRVDSPYLAHLRVVGVFAGELTPQYDSGIHESAVVAPDAEIGENVRIGPFCQIEKGARIGDNTTVLHGSYIGHNAILGSDCMIYPNVTIRERCELGDRVIVHPGVVIGADGFGFEEQHGRQVKVPQIGIVSLENDVEVGAGTTIDRAVTGVTRIGEGTKLDNLVQIGHNADIGRHTVIAAQTGIAGSARIGDYCVFGGRTGLIGHTEVGDRVSVGAGSIIMGSVDAGKAVMGLPASDIRLTRRIYAAQKELPNLIKRIRALEKKLKELDKEREQ